MKKILTTVILVVVAFISTNAQANSSGKNLNATVLKFTNGNTFDFGTIPEGPIAEHNFEFTNTDTRTLIITNISASSGSVTAVWSKEPVLPGKKGVIKVHYTTQGQVAPFEKSLFITSNVLKSTSVDGIRTEIKIKGTVIVKKS